MIKKISFFLVAVFTLFISINVNAECTTQDLEALDIYAANVKASYDLIDNSVKKSITEDGETKEFIIPNFAFNISIYNIVNDVYVKISNDVDDSVITVKNSDTSNNVYSFANNDFTNTYVYTIEVYSNNPACGDKKLKTINLNKPRYNVYSETDYCQNSAAQICHKFVSTNEITYEDFLERISENNEKKSEPKQSKIKTFLSENNKRIAIIAVLITFVVVLIIIVKHNIDDNKMKKGGWKI